MIDPRGMSFIEWADRLTPSLARSGAVPRANDDWMSWATAVCDLPTVRAQNPPSPTSFAHWEDWAQHFNRIDLQQG